MKSSRTSPAKMMHGEGRTARPRPLLVPAILLTVFVTAAGAFGQTPAPLRRAVEAAGGDAALERARSVSVALLGTQDLSAIGQGYFSQKPTPQRQQESLIVDEPSRRAVLRTEGSWSDGIPTVWRRGVLGDAGFSLKVKTGSVSRTDREQTALLYEALRWRVPQLALADMRRRSDKLRCGESRTTRGRGYDVCLFESERGLPLRVLFSRRTGHLAGYEYTAPTMLGPRRMRYEFKPYVATGVGPFPSGYRFLIGDKVYKDLNMLDARPAALESHPWLVPPPADARPVSSVPQQPPAAVEEVAPGVWFLRNVGGYNVMFARVGDCAAVFDAPASYSQVGEPIPGPVHAPDRSAIIMRRVREVTGMSVCYVIPSHHHYDHFGGLPGFARAGATVVVTPNSEALARALIRSAGVRGEPKFRLVRGRLTLGAGDGRVEVWSIPDDPHADSVVFMYLPGRGLAFEGDISDYVPSAWNFLRFVRRKGLRIDRVFSSHGSRPLTLTEVQWEEPDN